MACARAAGLAHRAGAVGAAAAHVPVALAFIDYPRREIGIGAYVELTGEARADMARIAEFYADKTGRRPERQGPVQLAPSEAP